MKWILQLWFLLVPVLAAGACGRPVLAPAHTGESPAGITGGELILGEVPEAPAAVRADVEAFNAVYGTLVPGGTDNHEVSPNGRAVAVGRYTHQRDGGSEPHGVYVWPDWRDAQNVIIFEDFEQVEFRSNHHVYLLYWPRGQSPRTKFVDLRHPEVRFQFSDYWRRLVSIADDGRWAGVTIGGTLRVGRLDPDDPEISRQTTVIDLPEGAEVERLMHRRGGDILVVQFKGGTIRSYPAAGGAPLDTTQGGFGSQNLMVGDHRFYGWNDATEGAILFSVEADGTFTWEQWPFMAGVRDWGAVWGSPSGRYVVMKRRVWPGNVEYKIRKTPLADDGAPVPRITHPEIRDDQLGWLMGWLTW